MRIQRKLPYLREPVKLRGWVYRTARNAVIDHYRPRLGLSLTATKSRVRRTRLMLREMLAQCCRFEFDRRGKVIEAIPRKSCDC